MDRARMTKQTRKRYDRIAPFYDLMEGLIESARFAHWRERLGERVQGPRALEIGVGTGKNMLYYPGGVEIIAIDLSSRMLARARTRAKDLGIQVNLREMDVQQLDFPDKSFDTVFATFVFCSVPDPVLGLKELHRVCNAGGRLLLLEHMRPENPILGRFFDVLNPIVVRMTGANINRKSMENVAMAGWKVELEENLSSNIVRWIEARP